MVSVNDMLIMMIKSIDLFKELSDDDCLMLSKDFVLQYYPKGTVIIREGTRLDKIYILKNGTVQVRKASGHTSIILGEIRSGEIFGEMSFLKDQPSMASVVCQDDCDIWELPIVKFVEFLKKSPYIMDSIFSTLNMRENENRWKIASGVMGKTDKSDVDQDDTINIIL